MLNDLTAERVVCSDTAVLCTTQQRPRNAQTPWTEPALAPRQSFLLPSHRHNEAGGTETNETKTGRSQEFIHINNIPQRYGWHDVVGVGRSGKDAGNQC